MFIVLLSCMTTKAPFDSADAEAEPGFPTDQRYARVTEQIFADMQALNAGSGALAIFDSNGVIHAAAFGTDSTGEPLEPDAQFRMGSLTKVFTSILVNRQIEASSYAYGDRLVDLLPALRMPYSSGHLERITVEDLLTHRGAFVDWIEIDGASVASSLSSFVENVLPELYIMADPGQFFNYSNPNFYLAGYLAEQHGGASYAELMNSEVFGPLGMSNTTFSNEEVLERGKWGAGTDPSGEITPQSYDNVWAAPAGYAWTTVMDVAQLGKFLLNGDETILSAETLERLQSPLVDTYFYGPLGAYGHGLFIGTGLVNGSTLYPQKMVSHGGDINGYATDFLLFPEQGLGIITLSGASGAHPSTGFAEFFEREGFYDNGIPLPEEWNPLEELSIYAGVFQDPFNVGEVITEVDNTRLRVSMPKLDQLDIPYQSSWTRYARHTFVANIQGYDMLVTFPEIEGGFYPYLATRFFAATRAENGPNEDEDVNRSHWSSASAEQERARLIELFHQANEDFRLRKH